MLAVIISIVIVLLFMAGLSYRWLKPVFAARKGRPVDVKVRCCMKKELPRGEGWADRVYYEVVVDFCDANGEALVRSLRSATPYKQGDVIRCRYVDKSGYLLPENSTEVQPRTKYNMLLLLLLIFFIIFVGMMASFIWGMKHEGKWEFHWSSSPESTEQTTVLELTCYYDDTERESFNYGVYLDEDGSGRILLFPMKTVSGKEIDQEIKFTVSQENMEEIMQWIQKTDMESLTQEARQTEETAAYISLKIYSGEEQYSGGGYCDKGIYEDICGLLQKAVPADVWEEMEQREVAYYQR